MDKLKTYYQLYAKTGKIGKFKENFNKGRRCPICKKRSISSHSISLKYLSDLSNNDNEVLHLPKLLQDSNNIDYMELKTIKEVSTFHGFCKDHDSNLFKSIENFNGLPDEKSINLEQVVLMGLRAVARREYDNSFCIKMLEQHEKNPARKYEKYIKATNFYLDTYLKALSDPSIIDYTVIDFPQELFGNFLCAAYDDGVCVVTLPLQNQKLRAYISTTKASNKISLYKDNPKSVLLKALNNNMCFSPSWWSSISQDLKKKLLPNILAGKMCETVDYKGNVRKLQL